MANRSNPTEPDVPPHKPKSHHSQETINSLQSRHKPWKFYIKNFRPIRSSSYCILYTGMGQTSRSTMFGPRSEAVLEITLSNASYGSRSTWFERHTGFTLVNIKLHWPMFQCYLDAMKKCEYRINKFPCISSGQKFVKLTRDSRLMFVC